MTVIISGAREARETRAAVTILRLTPHEWSETVRRLVARQIDVQLCISGIRIAKIGGKIARIKAIRKIATDDGFNWETGFGLKDAKEWVEAQYADYGKGRPV